MSLPDFTTDTADREIVIRRVLNAPRELVYSAWTDPQRLAHWYGPNGFRTTTQHMDMRAGGEWRFVMHGPDGRDYPNRIQYLEVVPNERIVTIHSDDAVVDPIQFHSTITFEDLGGKTRLTLRMVFPNAATKDRVEREHGAIQGAREHVNRLASYIAGGVDQTAQGLTMCMASDRTFVLTRYFNAPRPLVFEALTKPEHVRRWWTCEDFQTTVCELDVRPGGVWRIVQRAPDGTEHPFCGEYREVVAPERIVQTFVYDVEFIRDHPAVETLTLDEIDGRTRLTATVVHDSQASRDGHLASGMEDGAAASYDRLAGLLAELQSR
jgi:uncharacterized protein YndB with AHSA1/START domain